MVDLTDVYIVPLAVAVPGTKVVLKLIEIAQIVPQGMGGSIALILKIIGEAIDVLVRCPAIPIDSREALRDAWAAAQQAWGNVSDEAIPALEDACTAGRDAVKKAATQLCPDLAQY